jgi:flavin-dependent dehydrogenase
MNTLGRAKFFSGGGTSFELKSSYPVYLLNRPALDRFLFESAQKAGVKTKIGERFQSYRKMKGKVKIKTDKKIYYSKLLIGADGANSTVGREAKLKYPSDYLVGVQTTATGDFDTVELWFGSKISPRFFAWLAPESESVARIGLATNPNAAEYYQKFLTQRIGKVVKPDVGGIIRGGLMERTAADHVMVVGDAACQIKPYSGGGINYGLISSQYCANAALSALEQNDFSEKFLMENYDAQWKKELGPAIKRGMVLLKLMNSPPVVMNGLFGFGKIASGMLRNLDMDLINVFV